MIRSAVSYVIERVCKPRASGDDPGANGDALITSQ